jgi:alpha-tubulin suppressor-like RCC1 family protein
MTIRTTKFKLNSYDVGNQDYLSKAELELDYPNFNLPGQVKTGTLWAWGYNSYGQLGDGTIVDKSSPVQVGALTDWKQISGSGNTYFTTAIKTDGTLWAWGWNGSGNLGDGLTSPKSSPSQVGALTTWASVMSGDQHVIATKTDGTLWAWGWNSNYITYSQLGDGLAASYLIHVQIGTTGAWKRVSNGRYHTAAIKTDGTLWAWGRSNYGQRGSGTLTDSSTPVQVGALTTWAEISCGEFISVAVKTDGTLWSWGWNNYGALGDGTTVDKSSPVQIGSLTNWSKVVMTAYSVNPVAIKTDGTLWTWGYNSYGQLGDGTTVNKSSPIQMGVATNWSSAGSTYNGVIALKTDGTLWSCGYNGYGQLGHGDVTHRSTLTQIGALTNWRNLGLGYQSIVATKTDGTLWAWGNNYYGQCANNTNGVASPNHISSPTQVGSLTDWQAVPTVGTLSFFATKTDGTLWTWGYGGYGLTGLASAISKSSPTQVGSGTDWANVIASANNVHSHLIKSTNTLYASGYHNDGLAGGQLGDGTSVDKSSPVQIGALTNWKTIATKHNHSLALKTDGTLWSWGWNTYGALGDGTTVDKSSPVQVGSGTNWKFIATARNTSAAIKTDGTLWTWGYNNYGQLGDGTTVNKSSPVQVGSGTNWKQIACTADSMSAVKTDGTLWSWGYNSYGQLGDGTIIRKSTPIQVGSLRNWKKVNTGYVNVIATKTDGTLWAWGENSYGSLGNGTIGHSSSPVQVGSFYTWKSATGGAYSNYAIK